MAAINTAGAEAVIDVFCVADFAYDEPVVRSFWQLFINRWG